MVACMSENDMLQLYGFFLFSSGPEALLKGSKNIIEKPLMKRYKGKTIFFHMVSGLGLQFSYEKIGF